MTSELPAFSALPVGRLGELVRQAREVRGVSQADLATRARVPLPMLVAWEEGIARPDPSTLERVAAALGLRGEQLVPQRQAMRLVPGSSDPVRAFVRIVESMRNVARRCSAVRVRGRRSVLGDLLGLA